MHKPVPNPEGSASLPSRLLFWFVTPLLRLGYRRPLELEDLYDVLPENDAANLTNGLAKHWRIEVENAKSSGRPPKLMRAVYSLEKRRFWSLGWMILIEELIRVLQPFFMGKVIRFFHADGGQTLTATCIYAAALSLCSFFFAISHHRYFYRMQIIGMQTRIACSGLIYAKLLTVDSAALRRVTVGHVVNLISNDVSRCDQVVLFLHYFWAAPVSLIALIIILYFEMRSSCFAGLGVLFVMIPIQVCIGRTMGNYRRKVAAKSDKRISIMNEILNAVRVIKMYAWEYPFMTLVHDARAEEMQKLRRHALCQAIVIGSYYVTGRIALLGALAAYVLTNKAVTSEVVFVGAAMFNAARLTLSLYLPFAVQNYLELSVTLNRIQKFLLLADKTENRTQLTESLIEKQKQGMVSMKSVSASWDEDVKDHIVSVTFSVQPGQLLAIVGPLGSGKSMILQTLLKEVVHNKGEVVVNGSIAYVPQEAWLFPGTIRQNVLFGRDMDVERYRDALNVSALMRDLIRLPKGDLTVIGDKGTTLSGGQKARINLARAVYQDADIYLLDDPLSAVDTAVGKSIFESCLLGHLKNKTRILVTHQLQYLKSADNGVQVGYGTYEQLIATGDQFTHILQETELSYHGKVQLVSESLSENDEENEELYDFEISSEEKHLVEGSAPVVYFRPSGDNRTDSTYQESRKLLEPRDDVNKAVNGELPTATHDAAFNVLEEYTGSKGVSYKTYFTYLREIGHPCVLTCLLSMAILVQGFYTFCDWWLHQSNEEDIRKFMSMYPLNITMAEERKKRLSFFTGFDSVEHLKIWTCMIVTLLLVSVLQAIVLRFSLLRSAFRLHSRMFHHVIRASIVFFDRNPVGRILNRFSKDTNVMDELLAFVFFDFFLGSLVLLSYVLVNGLLNPWLFLVLAPLLCAFAFLRNYYMRSARALKRLEAAVRSPLYSHFSATISGLAVIRAFNAEEKVIGNYLYHQNTHSTTWSAFLATSRLFSVCVDCLSAVYVTLVAFVSVFTASALDSGSVGLSLFYAIGISGALAYCMKQLTTTEEAMVSVERIIEYGKLPKEAELTSAHPPHENWPSRGEVVFKNVSLRYSADSPYILRNVSFTLKAGEKLGLVGRTGAGKSSVITALFRLVEPEGQICIDGVDISTLGLHELRKKISIIPQDPILFLGTLRQNLDPFGEHSDAEIWNALEQVRLKEAVASLRNGLGACTHEGGQNFSVGQRQLICLARALLRKNRILVLDEATANVDLNTDSLIQETIRVEFKHCSVLTIAHRLNTIMDCDRVIVLHEGQLVEYDEPAILLRRSSSMFAELVSETGSENAEVLRRIAENAMASRRCSKSRNDEDEKKMQ
ncbi:hypothetical protein M513_00054 [Trichuris suis]|uniref:ABC transporter, ATP-binding protein n=1 Tax=Trichuris suis TaxID=68888 RepID=A0A085MNU5_9BILA|nr:hypothetical protein M513_00054 [Trichuris suis]